MTAQQWEEIDVPRGAYVGWGTAIGQHVTGKVIAYDESGGTDFNSNPCPRLDIELSDTALSYDKDNNVTQFPAGEFVVLNCGQVSLKRAVRAAALNPGDLVKVELSNLVKVDKGTVKEFSIKVARGAGGSTSAPPAAAPVPKPAPAAADPWATAPAATSGPVYPPGITAEMVAAVKAQGLDPANLFPGYVPGPNG